MNRVVSTAELARLANVHYETVQTHASRGVIPAPDVLMGRSGVYSADLAARIVDFYRTTYQPYRRYPRWDSVPTRTL